MAKQKNKQQALLKGWSVIAKFLGLPPTSAQRWAKEGMPIRREGRFTVADPGELQAWLGRESHMKAPARVMIGDTEIAAALKDSLAVARNEKKRDQDMGGRYRLSATERCLSQYFNLDPKDVAWAAR